MGSVQRSIDVCILIPCYNNLPGLIESINSIIYHPGCFLVLVVDDGSDTAITRTELFQHVSTLVDIQIVRLRNNMGITRALNNGLDFIYANYAVCFIARLDCGDTCDPARFYRQVSFLKKNPATDLLGTWCYFKDRKTGFAYEYSTPTQHKLIERSMYFRNVFVHPTVMWRTAALDTFRYPEKYPHAEDYGLFYDIISRKRTAIIGDFLVTCEINKSGISLQNRSGQLKSRMRVIWDYGKNKWWLIAGTIKLILLMALPYQFIYQVKKKVYKQSAAT